jgi:hypothetical protein
MPTYEELYAFLKAHYKHERFEGRNADPYHPDYSHIVTRGRMRDLEKQGYDLISRHESRTGERVIFDRRLQELPGLPIEAAGRAGG